MGNPVTVRRARAEDAADMARVIVRSWRETYRGVVPDRVLDDPGFESARERFWTAALTDPEYHENRIAVAERDGAMIGVAMSGPVIDPSFPWRLHLYVLYVLADAQGSGVGTALLHEVVGDDEAVALWVADPNPRAQAFYRKHGFIADGTVQLDDGIREIRMVRLPGRAG